MPLVAGETAWFFPPLPLSSERGTYLQRWRPNLTGYERTKGIEF